MEERTGFGMAELTILIFWTLRRYFDLIDTVDRDRIWLILEKYGILVKYIDIISMFYEAYLLKYHLIRIQSGIRQECVSSPKVVGYNIWHKEK